MNVEMPSIRIIQTVQKVLNDITPAWVERSELLRASASLKSLGLDSLAIVDLVLQIEDELQIAFPDEFLNEETFATVESLLDAVERISTMGKQQAASFGGLTNE